MIFKRVKSGGLAQISYFIADRNEAAVIDPRRDCDVYFELAEKNGTSITHILETHRHEDFVLGSKGISGLSGATIHHGPLNFQYGEKINDGEMIKIGRLEIRALHTPGHTDESMSYVVIDRASGKEPIMIFTGDALFVDEVGRIDLYGKEEKPRMARNLYESVFEKILPLGDHVILCPAHGAGSACGAKIGEREQSTLGIERLQNPRLQLSQEDFIRFKIEERIEFPPYFKKMEELNLIGPPRLGHLPEPRSLLPDDFYKELNRSVVIDTRSPSDFAGLHIQGSYSIWMEGFASFIGWFVPYGSPILLVVKNQLDLRKCVRELVREGYDYPAGYLSGGMNGWAERNLPFQRLNLQSAEEAKKRIDSGEDLTILDVRFQHEWDEGHIEGAQHIMVGELEKRLDEIPRNRPILAFCSSGHRGSIAGSILQRHGFEEITNVLGAMTAWNNAGYPTVK